MSLAHTIPYDIASQTPTVNTIIGRWFVDGFRNITTELFPAGTVSMSLKFAKSNQVAEPDFNTASSATNQWSFCDVIDLNDGSSIDGTTGVALSATTTRTFEWNNNESKWVAILCTAYATGTIAGNVLLSTNQ